MMVLSLVLQLLGVIGLPVGGWLIADTGGMIIGLSLSAVYVGLAVEEGS